MSEVLDVLNIPVIWNQSHLGLFVAVVRAGFNVGVIRHRLTGHHRYHV